MRGTMRPADLLVLGFQRISARGILARHSCGRAFRLSLSVDAGARRGRGWLLGRRGCKAAGTARKYTARRPDARMSSLLEHIQVRRVLETLMLILLGNAQVCLEEGLPFDPCMCLLESEADIAHPVMRPKVSTLALRFDIFLGTL